MPRRLRTSHLETRSARLRLEIAARPQHWTTIAPGVALAYRRTRGAGRWVVRVFGGGGRWEKKLDGIADDLENANGETVLDFFQAQDKARVLARGGNAATGNKPLTLDEALTDYAADLIARGRFVRNSTWLRAHLPRQLLEKPVCMLTSRDLKMWRDGKIKNRDLNPAGMLRLSKLVKACLNLAARHDKSITNRDAWRDGLEDLASTHNPRNVILDPEQVRAVVIAATEIDVGFGLLCETMAVTGARQCQLARLEIGDLQDDRPDPRLMMPSSQKGGGRAARAITRKPVPIPPTLAAKLRQMAGNRRDEDSLLVKSDGWPWRQPTCSFEMRPWKEAARRAGLDPTVTMYALRHSSIVRMLLDNVPIRLVADHHDTSVREIERTYSKHIAGHGDALVRRALLDLDAPATGNVVPLRR